MMAKFQTELIASKQGLAGSYDSPQNRFLRGASVASAYLLQGLRSVRAIAKNTMDRLVAVVAISNAPAFSVPADLLGVSIRPDYYAKLIYLEMAIKTESAGWDSHSASEPAQVLDYLKGEPADNLRDWGGGVHWVR